MTGTGRAPPDAAARLRGAAADEARDDGVADAPVHAQLQPHALLPLRRRRCSSRIMVAVTGRAGLGRGMTIHCALASPDSCGVRTHKFSNVLIER